MTCGYNRRCTVPKPNLPWILVSESNLVVFHSPIPKQSFCDHPLSPILVKSTTLAIGPSINLILLHVLISSRRSTASFEKNFNSKLLISSQWAIQDCSNQLPYYQPNSANRKFIFVVGHVSNFVLDY